MDYNSSLRNFIRKAILREAIEKSGDVVTITMEEATRIQRAQVGNYGRIMELLKELGAPGGRLHQQILNLSQPQKHGLKGGAGGGQTTLQKIESGILIKQADKAFRAFTDMSVPETGGDIQGFKSLVESLSNASINMSGNTGNLPRRLKVSVSKEYGQAWEELMNLLRAIVDSLPKVVPGPEPGPGPKPLPDDEPDFPDKPDYCKRQQRKGTWEFYICNTQFNPELAERLRRDWEQTADLVGQNESFRGWLAWYTNLRKGESGFLRSLEELMGVDVNVLRGQFQSNDREEGREPPPGTHLHPRQVIDVMEAIRDAATAV